MLALSQKEKIEKENISGRDSGVDRSVRGTCSGHVVGCGEEGVCCGHGDPGDLHRHVRHVEGGLGRRHEQLRLHLLPPGRRHSALAASRHPPREEKCATHVTVVVHKDILVCFTRDHGEHEPAQPEPQVHLGDRGVGHEQLHPGDHLPIRRPPPPRGHQAARLLGHGQARRRGSLRGRRPRHRPLRRAPAQPAQPPPRLRRPRARRRRRHHQQAGSVDEGHVPDAAGEHHVVSLDGAPGAPPQGVPQQAAAHGAAVPAEHVSVVHAGCGGDRRSRRGREGPVEAAAGRGARRRGLLRVRGHRGVLLPAGVVHREARAGVPGHVQPAGPPAHRVLFVVLPRRGRPPRQRPRRRAVGGRALQRALGEEQGAAASALASYRVSSDLHPEKRLRRRGDIRGEKGQAGFTGVAPTKYIHGYLQRQHLTRMQSRGCSVPNPFIFSIEHQPSPPGGNGSVPNPFIFSIDISHHQPAEVGLGRMKTRRSGHPRGSRRGGPTEVTRMIWQGACSPLPVSGSLLLGLNSWIAL